MEKSKERETVLTVREIEREERWWRIELKKWNWATNITRIREFMIMIINSCELSTNIDCTVPNPHYWHLNTHPHRHILLWIPLWERCIFCMICVGTSVWKGDRDRQVLCTTVRVCVCVCFSVCGLPVRTESTYIYEFLQPHGALCGTMGETYSTWLWAL